MQETKGNLQIMKRAILEISAALLAQILKGMIPGSPRSFNVRENAIPEDAVYVGFNVSGPTEEIGIAFDTADPRVTDDGMIWPAPVLECIFAERVVAEQGIPSDAIYIPGETKASGEVEDVVRDSTIADS